MNGSARSEAGLLSPGLRETIWIIAVALVITLTLLGILIDFAVAATVLRLGYFPNITHSQAIIGMANGEFAKSLGPGVEIQSKVFNAGPSAIEALFAGQLDISYIGPNPAINGYVRSDGKALKIIAGATSGGAGLVVRERSGIKSASDFHGKRIASPQLGNTQDVAVRAWLMQKGYKLKEKGGDVEVIPLANPDQLNLFLKNEIDGAWTVEPWVTRLIREGNGRLFQDERSLWPDGKFVTAHVIVNTKFLKEHPDVVRNFLRAHVKLTRWIKANLPTAKKVLNEEIAHLTSQGLPDEIINEAFTRLEVTYDPVRRSLLESADDAYRLGFLGTAKPDLSGIYALELLNEVLAEQKLPPVR